MTYVFNLLNIVVGQVQQLEIRHIVQSLNFQNFVIVELQFDQIWHAIKAQMKLIVPLMTLIRLFLNRRLRNDQVFSVFYAISPNLQLIKFASYFIKQLLLLLIRLQRVQLREQMFILSFFILMALAGQQLSLFRNILYANDLLIDWFSCFLDGFTVFPLCSCLIINAVIQNEVQTQRLYVLQIHFWSMKLAQMLVLLCLAASAMAIVDRTYFNYLGLKISASPEDVQRAYSQKKAKIEGLQNQQERSKKLKLLSEAYQTLSNDKERQKYERYGKDIFRTIKEMTCIDKRNPESPKDQRKSPSFKLTIPVSIGDIYNGAVIKAKYPKVQACPVCQGTGAKSPKDIKPCPLCSGKGFSLRDQTNFYGQKFQAESLCPTCRGSGKTVIKTCDKCKGQKLIPVEQTIQIPIPKGLPNGNVFTIRNIGQQPLHGAPSDFQITVIEVPRNNWSREGNNLVYLLEISLQQSLFGFTKTFQHLDGQEVSINRQGQMTTKDTKHIVRERGFINKQGFAGNLVIKFKVTIPRFTDEQLDLWQEFFEQHPM